MAGQAELSLILFDLPEFGVTSPCKLAEAGRIPGIPPDNVESTALIDSDDLLAPAGGADGGVEPFLRPHVWNWQCRV